MFRTLNGAIDGAFDIEVLYLPVVNALEFEFLRSVRHSNTSNASSHEMMPQDPAGTKESVLDGPQRQPAEFDDLMMIELK